MINALIVDDELSSRQTISNYITKYCPSVSLIGEAENISVAQEIIKKHQPDLVFLDIEMPYGNAFDLLEKYESIPFEIIFITAFSKYAIEALNLSASRYLLKPVSIDDLIEAVESVEKQLQNKQDFKTSSIILENIQIENKQLKKMVLPLLDGFEVIRLQDIIRCQANDNLTDIYLKDNTKRTVCKTLKFYEDALNDFDFIRVHRSHIINANEVKQYRKASGGEVILSDGSELPISPTRKEKFLQFFSSY